MELKDILYTDVERIRGLLAQLERGVVEEVIERFRGEDPLGLKLGPALTQAGTDQVKSLRDALFLLFEEAAEKAGLLEDVPELENPDAWSDGRVHAGVDEGQLLRCTTSTRIVDSELARARLSRFITLGRTSLIFTESEGLAKAKNAKEREKISDKLFGTMMDGVTPEQIEAIGLFLETYFGGGVSVRQFPCGSEYPAFSLSGTLLSRSNYIQEEREALFTKYGSGVSRWTMLAQVASVPLSAPKGEDGASPAGEETDDDSAPTRLEFEGMATEMMEIMEQLGAAGGPTFPSISVTPLAIYRAVPTHPFVAATG